NFAVVVLNNLLNDGETQPRTIFFSLTHEGFEQLVTDGIRNSTAIVSYRDLDPVADFAEFNDDVARTRLDRLTSIQKQIEKSELKLSMIEPAFHISRLPYCYGDIVKLGISLNRVQRALHRGLQAAVRRCQRRACA